MSQAVLLFGILFTVLLTSAASAHAAILWDLIITAEFEQVQISQFEKPVILGRVVDHAMKPIPDAEIRIRFADVSVITTTNSTGSFRYEFDERAMPGTFTVNIYAKTGDLKGFAKTTLQVGKESSTFNDLYYKSGEAASDIAGNPYTALQLKHYQKYIEDQEKRKQKYLEIEAKKLAINEKRDIAKQKTENATREEQVGPGVYSGYEYNMYISKLNPAVKDTITSQLNYTRNLFEEAQYAMKKVLEDGGTREEARKVYLEKLSTTKEQIDSFGSNSTEPNQSKIKKHDSNANSKKVKGLTVSGSKYK